jgi:hypothetical protein
MYNNTNDWDVLTSVVCCVTLVGTTIIYKYWLEDKSSRTITVAGLVFQILSYIWSIVVFNDHLY